MRKENKRYQEMVRFMQLILLGDCLLFILSLVAAGAGIAWVRIPLRVLTALVSLGGIGLLYLNKELFRPRSRWIVAAFAAILLCLAVSTIVNYPSPYVPPILPKTAFVLKNMFL